jgi:hypothetical protein
MNIYVCKYKLYVCFVQIEVSTPKYIQDFFAFLNHKIIADNVYQDRCYKRDYTKTRMIRTERTFCNFT